MPTVSQANYATYSSTSAPVVTIDSGATEGQLLVAFIGDSNVPMISAVPTGWKNVVGAVGGAESTVAVLYCLIHKISAAEESGSTTTWTLTGLFTGTSTGWVTAVVIDDPNEDYPIDAVNVYWSNAVTTTHNLAGLEGDSLHDDSLVLSCVVADGSRNYSTAPTGWSFVDNTSSANPGMAVLSKDALTVAGTDIPETNITVNSTDECESITVAFMNAGEGPPAPSCALVQSANGSANGASSIGLTLGSTPVVGNLLVVTATYKTTNTTPTISGSGWSAAIIHSVLYNAQRWEVMWWKEVGSSEPTSITVSFSPSTTGTAVVSEYSGLASPTLVALTPSSTPINLGENRVVYNVPAISDGPGIAVNSLWGMTATTASSTVIDNDFIEVAEVVVGTSSQHVAWRELSGEDMSVTGIQLPSGAIVINVVYVFAEDGAYCPHPYLYAVGEIGEFASGTTITTPIPSGAATDDYMVLALMCNSSTTFSTPSGWTEIGTAIESDANQSTKWFAKVHDGSESDPASTTSATLSTTVGGYGRILVYRNIDTSSPIEDVTMAGSPTTSNSPQTAEITTTDVNRLAVSLVSIDAASVWNNGHRPPPLWGGHGLQTRTNTGGDACFEGIAKYVPHASVVPITREMGRLAGSAYWRTLTMALIPAPTAVVTEGDISGAISWVGSVTGARESEGSVSGGVSWVGTVNGSRESEGSVSGAISWVGIVIGADLGIVIGSISWVGTVNGSRVSAGSISGNVGWSGSVDGDAPVVGGNDGSLSGSISWVGTVNGSRESEGSISGAISWVGSVTSAITVIVGFITGEITGPATTTYIFNGLATSHIVNGPNLSRVVEGPSQVIEVILGLDHKIIEITGPDVSRVTTGPGTSRILTGPET